MRHECVSEKGQTMSEHYTLNGECSTVSFNMFFFLHFTVFSSPFRTKIRHCEHSCMFTVHFYVNISVYFSIFRIQNFIVRRSGTQ